MSTSSLIVAWGHVISHLSELRTPKRSSNGIISLGSWDVIGFVRVRHWSSRPTVTNDRQPFGMRTYDLLVANDATDGFLCYNISAIHHLHVVRPSGAFSTVCEMLWSCMRGMLSPSPGPSALLDLRDGWGRIAVCHVISPLTAKSLVQEYQDRKYSWFFTREYK